MCCPALSRRALSAFVAHWKFQADISIPAILPHRLEERWFCQDLQGASHPLSNPSFKPLLCFSSNIKLTAVWHLDVTAIAPIQWWLPTILGALAACLPHHHLSACLERQFHLPTAGTSFVLCTWAAPGAAGLQATTLALGELIPAPSEGKQSLSWTRLLTCRKRAF